MPTGEELEAQADQAAANGNHLEAANKYDQAGEAHKAEGKHVDAADAFDRSGEEYTEDHRHDAAEGAFSKAADEQEAAAAERSALRELTRKQPSLELARGSLSTAGGDNGKAESAHRAAASRYRDITNDASR